VARCGKTPSCRRGIHGALTNKRAATALLEPSRAWVSSLHSCEFFVLGAKIREAFLLGKVAREWRSLVLA
jgi:hypothetical protein